MLTEQELANDYARINRVQPAGDKLDSTSLIDSGHGDAAALNVLATPDDLGALIQTASPNNPAIYFQGMASEHATDVVLDISLLTGAVPTLQQEAGWTFFLNNGGSEQAMIDAFVQSHAFAQHFGIFPDVINPSAPAALATVNQVIFIATGHNATMAQDNAWVGQPTDSLIEAFAHNETYHAIAEPHVANYFADSIDSYNGVIGAHYAAGDLLSV